MEAATEARSTSTPREIAAWSCLGALLLTASLAQLFANVWRSDLHRMVPTPPAVHALRAVDPGRVDLLASDSRFNVWATSHGARALLGPPTRLFEGTQCHPAETTLAYGHPLLTYGLLALPTWLASGDPILSYNAALVATLVLGALAMFLLVRDWTGLASAGVVAGIVYGLSATKVGPVNWPFIPDTAFSVMALFFARRFAAHGRWRDGIGGAVCCGLQLGVSFYPVLAAACVAVPTLAWLAAAYGLRRVGSPAGAVSLLLLGALTAVVLGPYLAVRESQDTLQASTQLFAPWASLLRRGGLGWLAIPLVLAGLLLPRRLRVPSLGADPRWALLVAALLSAWLGTGGRGAATMPVPGIAPGPSPLPNLYAALATVLPGLDAVRLPGNVLYGVHLVAAILVGMGAAALIRSVPQRWASVVALTLVLGVWSDTVRPRWLGLEPFVTYESLELRPSDAALAFFAELERIGNRGPILELPIASVPGPRSLMRESERVLLSSYHQRRTSACYNSFAPGQQAEVTRHASSLPAPAAVAALREMGFTTIVLRRARTGTRSPLERRLSQPDGPLQTVLSTPERAAYSLDSAR